MRQVSGKELVPAEASCGQCSERTACRHFELHRSTFQYGAKQPNAWLACLKAALRRVSRENPKLDYAKITRLLKEQGWRVGQRLIQRLRRQLGLVIAPRKPRERRRGVSTGLPTTATHRNEVWTWDLIHDTTLRGGMLRMLTVIDEYTRECLDREQLWTLTEARVVIEDWRWKYNHIRPHRSLGYITPMQFARRETETHDTQGSASGRPAASLRPNLDFLYNLKHIIKTYQANSPCGPVWVT